MIDTLKLAKRLEAANMEKAQAEALAEGLADSLKESYVSREFLQAELARMQTRLVVSTFAIVVSVVGVANGLLFWALRH